MTRCDICIEEDCNGRMNCDCNNCKVRKECNKVLHPTIRITTKCTQKCSHCCFECSPKKNDFMTPQTAINISKFLKNNEIKFITIMGGEIVCHSMWKIILYSLIENVNYVRIVSNGDWAKNGDDFVKEILQYKEKIKVSLSKDKWHTNKHIGKAEQYLKEYGIVYNIATIEQTTDNSIVPIGASELNYSIYSTFGTYCSNPKYKYSFLIDEDGEIYKCGFGVCDYANINEYLDGGFCKRFKEMNQKFYSTFIGNCSNCIRVFKSVGKRK